MDDKTCMVEVARFFMNFTQNESCGKCVPCREGTLRMLEILERIVNGHGREGDIEMLEEIADMVSKTSLCGLGKTAPSPVLSTKRLQLVGVGYKAEKKGKTLVMHLGYSHPVELPDPEGITTETPDVNTVIVSGTDKALVGNYAANIRAWRKPEPYKGKGIKYENEHIRRKEGKTGAGA